nr:hypothetical protein CFP56_30349 [Quercus suber]
MVTILLFVAITKPVRRLGNKDPKTSFVAKEERVRHYRFLFLYSLTTLNPSPRCIELHTSRHHHLRLESPLSRRPQLPRLSNFMVSPLQGIFWEKRVRRVFKS